NPGKSDTGQCECGERRRHQASHPPNSCSAAAVVGRHGVPPPSKWRVLRPPPEIHDSRSDGKPAATRHSLFPKELVATICELCGGSALALGSEACPRRSAAGRRGIRSTSPTTTRSGDARCATSAGCTSASVSGGSRRGGRG